MKKVSVLFLFLLVATIGVFAQPTISSVSPLVGYPASSVTITGSNFNTTPANNIVYFGATRATVNTASATSLTVTVPTGATYMPVSVNNTASALTGYSQYPFLPTYDNSAYIPGTVNMNDKVDFTTGTLPYSVSIGDLDGDGKADLAVANWISHTVSVFRNTGSSGAITAGSFAARVNFATGANPSGVAIGDLDRDGKADLAVVNDNSNTVSVFRNTSSSGAITSGSFAAKVDFTTGSGPRSVSIGDLDGDGKADLAVANYYSHTVSVFRNTGSSGAITAGSFTAKVDFTTSTNPWSVAIGDLDGDGKADLAVAIYGSATVSVFRNTGSSGAITSGSFAAKVDFTTGSYPYSVAIGDLDGDGKADLAVANAGSDNVSVFHNTSSSGAITEGSFAAKVDFTTGSYPYSLAIGDLDGDGKADLAVANFSSDNVSVIRNTSSSGAITAGSFAAKVDFTTGSQPTVAAIGDLDGDGKADLAVANRGSSAVSVIRNSPLLLPITGTASLCIGATTTLANATTGGTWSSASPSFATVGSTGIVTGVAAGTARISYTLLGASTSVIVTVDGVPPGTLTGANIIDVASTTTMTPTVIGGTWSSSNTSVATVDSAGVVTGLGEGTTTISYSVTNTCGSGTVTKPISVLSVISSPCAQWSQISRGPALSGADGYYTAIATDSNGASYVVYCASISGGIPDVIVIKKYNGYEYVSVGSPFFASGFPLYTDITVSNSGIPFVSFIDVGNEYKVSVIKFNGTSWEYVGNPGISAGYVGQCAITTDNAGVPYISYPDDTYGGKATVMKYNGSFWEAVGGVAFSAGTVNSTAVASDSSGGLYIAYYDYDSGYVVKKFDGSIWQTISSPEFTSVYPVGIRSLAVDNNGAPNVVFTNGSGLSVMKYHAGIWENVGEPDFFSGYSDFASITVDGNGVPAVLFRDYFAGQLSLMKYSGDSWVSVGGGVANAGVYTPSVAFDSDGIPNVICQDNLYNGRAVVRRYVDSSWAEVHGTVRLGVGDVFSYSMALDSSGTPYVAYVDNGTFVDDVVPRGLVIKYNGSTWDTVGDVNFGIDFSLANPSYYAYNSDQGLKIALDRNGTPYVAYLDALADDNATVLKFNGTEWEMVGTSGFTTGRPWETSFEISKDGVPFFAYTDYDNEEKISVKKYTTAGGWETVGAEAFTPSYAREMSMTIDTAGNPLVSFSDNNNSGKITVLKYESGSWNTLGTAGFSTNQIQHAYGSGTDVNVHNGVPYVVYSEGDYYVGGATVKKFNGTSWENVGPEMFSEVTPRYTSIAFDTLGVPIVCYGVHDGYPYSNTVKKFNGTNWITIDLGDMQLIQTPIITGNNGLLYMIGVNAADYTAGPIVVKYDNALAPITGTLALCEEATTTLTNTTTGGSWSSSNTSVATVNSSGVVSGLSAGTAVISYDLGACNTTAVVSVNPLPAPAAITGLSVVNTGATITLSNATTGGVWSSSNTSTATVGSTGVVTGVAAGTVTISYTVTNGCGAVSATKVVTVNAAALETEITGTLAVCVGAATMLSNATPDGTWSSSTTAVAMVDEETGVVTGIAAGTAIISYTLSGVSVTAIVTVNATPGTLSGTLSVCIGNTTSLSSSPSGGTWASGNTSRATVDAGSGLVTGVSTGNVDITYTLAGGCRRKVTVTVAATPAAITGALSLCAGSTTALSSATTGGSWSSAATGVATVDAGTGIVTGISTGAANISYSNGSCASTVIVTVNAAAGANTGASAVCVGQATTLSNATTGGTWSSSEVAIATVHSSTGLVTGISAGLVNITYTATPGCFAITSFTVNATVAAITGTMTVCPSSTTALSSATSGGSWSSSNTARATVDAGTGVITGVSGGTVTISYIVSAGCSQTAIITVNTSPAGVSGTATVCEGATTTLTCSPGGGTWSSSSAAATVGSTGIVTGVSAGTATITYTAGTGCAATREVTINAIPAAIIGSLGVCVGSTSSLSSTPSGGTWAVTFTSKATVNSSTGLLTGVAVGTTPVTYTAGGCRTTATVSVVTTPAAIGGALTVCAGSTTNLTSATTGGTWTSSNTGVATVASGTGVVTGVATGTAIISYSNGSCETTAVVTVNASLAANTGSSTVCVGQGTDLNNATSGGTWSSSNTAIATVNATTGLVVGVIAGTVNISYRVGAGCFSITEMTVNATLSSITGTASVCPGATTALSHAVAGGVWTSGIPARATIDAGTGVVTGVSAGTVYITYAVGGCFTTRIVTVSAAPGAIGGTASVCEGGTITLTCSPTGGTWSSTVPATATVSGTGVVTGISAGTTTISYTRLGCAATRVVTVTSAPAAIGGTLSACIGTTTTLTSTPAGGTWSSSNPARFTVVAGTGVATGVSAGTATVTYAMSATCRATAVVTINASAGAISGSLTVCETCTSTLSSATSGGTWSSSNTAAATIGAGTGVVSGVGIGTTTISYVAGGCSSSAVVTVIAAIPSSFGTPVVCVGQTNATMGNPVAGGTWSSGNTSLATIHATTGLLTGIAVGNPNITYTTSPGVYTITVATVSAAVANITGTAAICPGATVALSNATTGGTWSSTNTAIATVNAGTGVVTGVTGGTSTISYFINVGCYKAITQTVNAAPNVTGANNVVNGASTTFGGSPGGGAWSSANPAIASVSGTGVVTGNSVAATTITYTLPATGCFGTRSINVVAARAGSLSGGVIEHAGVLKVFPNPTSGSITIDAPVAGSFTVYTIDGKKVAQYTIGATAVTAFLPQQLAVGVYMCRFNAADGTSAIVRLVYER